MNTFVEHTKQNTPSAPHLLLLRIWDILPQLDYSQAKYMYIYI